MNGKKAFPKISLDSQILYERLVDAKVGEIISYAELNSIIGRDVQTEAYSSLRTARDKARSRARMVFGVIRNVGWKCLDDGEKVEKGFEAIKKVRSRAHDGLKNMVCIKNYADLPDTQKVRHNTAGAILMLAHTVTAPKKVKALEGVISETKEKLTFTRTLEFFGKK